MYVRDQAQKKDLGEVLVVPSRRAWWQDVLVLAAAGIAAELLVDRIKGAKLRPR